MDQFLICVILDKSLNNFPPSESVTPNRIIDTYGDKICFWQKTKVLLSAVLTLDGADYIVINVLDNETEAVVRKAIFILNI